MKCSAWRSVQRPNYYVFCKDQTDIKSILPDSIIQFLVDLECFYTFELNKDKHLIGVDSLTVINGIIENGYFMRVPDQSSQHALLI